jgi:hypothetical protein
MHVAQYRVSMRQLHPDLDARMVAGDVLPAFDRQRTHNWSQASLWGTDTLTLRAVGEALNPAHFGPIWSGAIWQVEGAALVEGSAPGRSFAHARIGFHPTAGTLATFRSPCV